jgi:hypothetical protein
MDVFKSCTAINHVTEALADAFKSLSSGSRRRSGAGGSWLERVVWVTSADIRWRERTQRQYGSDGHSSSISSSSSSAAVLSSCAQEARAGSLVSGSDGRVCCTTSSVDEDAVDVDRLEVGSEAFQLAGDGVSRQASIRGIMLADEMDEAEDMAEFVVGGSEEEEEEEEEDCVLEEEGVGEPLLAVSVATGHKTPGRIRNSKLKIRTGFNGRDKVWKKTSNGTALGVRSESSGIQKNTAKKINKKKNKKRAKAKAVYNK